MNKEWSDVLTLVEEARQASVSPALWEPYRLYNALADGIEELLDRVETAERERDEYRDGTTIVKLTEAERTLQRIRDRHKPHRDSHKPDPSVIQANWFCCGAMQLGLIAPTDCVTCGVDYPCPEIQALEGDE